MSSNKKDVPQQNKKNKGQEEEEVNHNTNVSKQLYSLIKNKQPYSSHCQVLPEGINKVGVVEKESNKAHVYTKLQYTDIRSYLRTVARKSVDPIVIRRITSWLLHKGDLGVPISYDDIKKYLLLHKIQESTTDNYEFICHRIFAVGFSLYNKISLRRLRQPGFTSTWIKDLSIDDQDTLNKYMHLIRKVDTKRNNPPSHLFNRGSPLSYENKASSTSISKKRGKPLSPDNRANETSTSYIDRSIPQPKLKSSSNQLSTLDSTRGLLRSSRKSSTNHSSQTSASRGLPQSKSSSSSTSYIRGLPQSRTNSSVTSNNRGLPQSKSKASSPPSTSYTRGLPQSTTNSYYSKEKRSISPECTKDSWEKLSTSSLEKHNNQDSNKSVSCKRTKIDAVNKVLSDKGEMNKSIPVQRSFNEMLHEQFKDMNIFHTPDDWLPESLLKSFGGSHVNQVFRKDASDYAIKNTLNRLKIWRENDIREAEQSDYNDDDSSESSFEYYSSDNDDGGPYASMNKYKKICKTNKLISDDDCTLVLKKNFQNNMLWDIGFQMLVYKDQGKLQSGKRFTSRCYCPCGRIHKKWKIKNGLEELMSEICPNAHFDGLVVCFVLI